MSNETLFSILLPFVGVCIRYLSHHLLVNGQVSMAMQSLVKKERDFKDIYYYIVIIIVIVNGSFNLFFFSNLRFAQLFRTMNGDNANTTKVVLCYERMNKYCKKACVGDIQCILNTIQNMVRFIHGNIKFIKSYLKNVFL